MDFKKLGRLNLAESKLQFKKLHLLHLTIIEVNIDFHNYEYHTSILPVSGTKLFAGSSVVTLACIAYPLHIILS